LFELVDDVEDPADSAALRIDLSAWRNQFDERRQHIIDLLAMGYNSAEVAVRLGVSRQMVCLYREQSPW
jgi:DNA-binding NarL/FixJ family response regulator